MYRITIELNDGTTIGPRLINSTMESYELREELAADPGIQIKFASAHAEIGLSEQVDVSGNHVSESEVVPLYNYQQVIDFLSRSGS